MRRRARERPLVERLVGSLGRLLPRETRQRIFEPACNDLVREHLGSGEGPNGRWSLAFGATKLVLGSVCFGLLHVVFDRKRVKRFFVGLAVFAGIIVIVGTFLLRDWICQIARY